MGMMGSIAKIGYAKALLRFIKRNRDKPPQQQIELLEKKIKQDIEDFDTGWD